MLRESAQDVGAPGYDPQTGFGLVNIPKALVAPTPLNDPLEPNDDIAFVDGTAFRTPDPYVWRGFPHGPIRASVDEIEDPIDVYRIRVPAHRSALVQLRTTFGDADLFVFPGTRRTLQGTPLGRSVKKGRRTDSVTRAQHVGRCAALLRRDRLGELDVAELRLQPQLPAPVGAGAANARTRRPRPPILARRG